MVALSTDQIRAVAIMDGYRAVMPFDTELPDDWAALLDQMNDQGDGVHPPSSPGLDLT